MRIQIVLVLIVATFLATACKEKKSNTAISASEDVLQGTTLADPVIYDMVIKNANPEDDWTEDYLRNLDRDKLIAIIFDAVYDERLVAYDFFTDEPLKIVDLRKLEKEADFSRDKIGKLQFEEEWAFDENNMHFQKKVKSMLLAYEVFNSAGELRGYKPAFYVKLN